MVSVRSFSAMLAVCGILFVRAEGAVAQDVMDHVDMTSAEMTESELTRDELPAWRDAPVSAEPALAARRPELVLYPNPSRGPATLRLTLREPADVRIEVYDALGRRVQTRRMGYHPAGEVEATVEGGMAAGVYVVRVVAGTYRAHRTLVVVR